MKSKTPILIVLSIIAFCHFSGCARKDTGKNEAEAPQKPFVPGPVFNEDSAYHFTSQQVKFGPRIPNSMPHKACGQYLFKKFSQYGGKVAVQEFTEESYDGQELQLNNFIISFDPEKTRRILLAAHWDTRPFADKDPMDSLRPFDGANDGASGVGVLIEIARILSVNPHPQTGIDIILFDGEDYGPPEFDDDSKRDNSKKIWWCLGSQHWSKNLHQKNYSAYYGILLDMVGAKNAKFYKEGSSVQFAKKITDKVWKIAGISTYSDIFINASSPGITDDHIFINRDVHIPTIDIIDYDPEREDSYFPEYHHTQQDNMNIIDKNTLKAVGQTLVNVIYNE
jgi:glutaminyl-peptide cyclotransferase